MRTAIAPAWRSFILVAFGLILATPAYALSGYWHGVRSDKWHHNPSGGVANWYSLAPPEGEPRAVPDDTAFFADGAVRLDVSIVKPASIGTIRFLTTDDTYTIRVNRRLEVDQNPGVVGPNGQTVPLIVLNAQMILRGRTNPGRVRYSIREDGIFELSTTRGNADNRVLTAHKITNAGRLIIGKNHLNVTLPYVQQADSFLTVQLGNDRSGLIDSTNIALDGTLVVKGTPGLEPGVYRIISASTREGEFANVSFQNFSPDVTPSIRYLQSNGNVSIRVVAND